MTRVILLLLVTVCAVAGGASGARETAVAPAAEGGTCPFGDDVADSGTGPDITNVLVTTDARGQFSFRITVANRPQPAGDDVIALNLDTDRNPSTGWARDFGGDYIVYFDDAIRRAVLFRWNGSALEYVPATSLSGSYVPGGVSISINRSELQGTTSFFFWVHGWQGSDAGASGRFDVAPDRGTWTYPPEEALYPDPMEDSGSSPDITCTRVSNTGGGQISFRIEHSALPDVAGDVSVGLFLDTDRNPRTGARSFRGAEYLFAGTLATRIADVFRWTGSRFESLPATTTASWRSRATYQLLSINRSELGGTRGFNFWVRSAQGSDVLAAQRTDDAPDTGTSSYRLAAIKATSLTELVGRVRSGVIRIEVETCEGRAIGSGILIGPRHVATVEHVVGGATTIALRRNGRRLATATVIGRDQRRDLALLKTSVRISGYRFQLSRRTPTVGEAVAALGYPVGLPLSVTRGSVSGINRSLRINGVTRGGLVQTDAAVNHGSSGGPLLAIETGELLGLVDLGSTRLNGIAFAISGRVARPLLSAWKSSPKPRPPAACG